MHHDHEHSFGEEQSGVRISETHSGVELEVNKNEELQNVRSKNQIVDVKVLYCVS